MGNRVVGLLDDNHFQLDITWKGPMRALPAVLALGALCALTHTPLGPRPVAAQQAADTEEHTTLGGYGEVQYQNASGPDSPGIVNVARFVAFIGHQFNDRISLRSELEVEDTKI